MQDILRRARDILGAVDLAEDLWLRPHYRLGSTEQAKANLARLLAHALHEVEKSKTSDKAVGVIIDEFCTAMDRACAERVSLDVAALVKGWDLSFHSYTKRCTPPKRFVK